MGRSCGLDTAPGVEDALMTVTLNTPDTIPHMIVFYDTTTSSESDPAGEDNPDAQGQTTTTTPPHQEPLITRIDVLCSLGPMVAGYVGVSHGGSVLALLDEVAGFVVRLNRGRGGIAPDAGFMTVSLSSRFHRAVRVPGTFLVSSRLDRLEGRKAFVSAWVEDENAAKLASADVLFSLPREKL